MDGSGDSGAPLALELRVFHCEEAFAYAVPPARSAAGHRAADWDVDKWLCKVHCSLCTLSGDAVPDGTAVVRLHDATSGELFAEAPLGVEVPIQAVVEPVVDSSRYFVIRLEDAVSKRHAFVGLGFAQRDNSTDFKMALSEVQTARDRDKEAQRRKAAHQAAVQGGGEAPTAEVTGDGGPVSPSAPRQDLSLPEGTKIVLNVPVRARAVGQGGAWAWRVSGSSGHCFAHTRAATSPCRAWPDARLQPLVRARRLQEVRCCLCHPRRVQGPPCLHRPPSRDCCLARRRRRLRRGLLKKTSSAHSNDVVWWIYRVGVLIASAHSNPAFVSAATARRSTRLRQPGAAASAGASPVLPPGHLSPTALLRQQARKHQTAGPAAPPAGSAAAPSALAPPAATAAAPARR